MSFVEFLRGVEQLGYGVVSFNTYWQDGKSKCFILVAGRGEQGSFFKRECLVPDFENILHTLYLTIMEHKASKC